MQFREKGTVKDLTVVYDFDQTKQEIRKGTFTQKQIAELGLCYDARTGYAEANVKSQAPLNDLKWYANYLVLNLSLSLVTAQSAWINYLPRIGYVPICFLPSYVTNLDYTFFAAKLQKRGIPYLQVRPNSFVFKYCDIQGSDLWVSKMDVADLVGRPPEQVTSVSVLNLIL